MTQGGNVVTKGLGSQTLVTEGYGYLPRAAELHAKSEVFQMIDVSHMSKLRQEVASVFGTLRVKYGEEVTVESILAAIDSTILAQPKVYKKVASMSPSSLAQVAYSESK